MHAPRCDAPQFPSTVSVGTFALVDSQPKQSTRLPLRIAFNRASYRVAAGSVLLYRVIVHNTSGKPFRFTRCPLYFESLGNAHEIHLLNCAPVGTLIPGASATFAMELRVPPNVHAPPSPGRFAINTYPGSASMRPVPPR